MEEKELLKMHRNIVDAARNHCLYTTEEIFEWVQWLKKQYSN